MIKNTEKNGNKKLFSDRKSKHRAVSIAITCFAAAAVIIVNIIASVLTDRYSFLTVDITDSDSFDLTSDSLEIAGNISKNVKITFLSSKSSYENLDPYCKQTSTLANKIAQNSNNKIKVEYVDLIKNPTYENNYPNSKLSTTDIIVSCGEKYRILAADELFNFEAFDSYTTYISSSKAEQVIDSAILTVTSDIVTNVVLINDNCTDDYSYFKTTLTSNNYNITEMSLITGEIPDNTDMIIVYAPTKDYTFEAVDKLEKFLENNGAYGKNMLYVPYSGKSSTPNIDSLLKKYGMKLDDGNAFDMDTSRIVGSNYYEGLMCGFGTDIYRDNITENDYPVIVSMSRAITILDNNSADKLLVLSDKSGVCPFDAVNGEWSMIDAVTGNVCVMAQGINGTDKSSSTLVVAGSTNMFEKYMLGSSFGNATYILDMFAELNDRDTDTLKIENKVISEYDLNISTQTASVVGVIVYGIIPLTVLAAGFVVFLIRRNK